MAKRKTSKVSPINPEFRRSVGESFNVYQATVVMLSIFLGFVFSGLLQLLISTNPMTTLTLSGIWLLTLAMLALTFALFCFLATAHRVIRYWGIFYPSSIYNDKMGAPAFLAGILLMFCCVLQCYGTEECL